MKRKAKFDWTQTPEGQARYQEARKLAQESANALGFDFGLERNDIFKYYHVFILPRRENRYGHETRCEVVMCENLDKCQPGHGPK